MSDILVYIDADNISYKYFPILYNELKNIQGVLQNIYVYADWSKSQAQNWLQTCKIYGLIPKMATKYTGVKESSDMLLVLDIMEQLYRSKDIGIFCIVSTDSDFTHIIHRLKMNSKKVFGYGMSYANKTLMNTYHSYTSIDLLYNKHLCKKYNKENNVKTLDFKIFKSAIEIIDDLLDKKGEFNAELIYAKIKKIYPTFDYRKYGFTRYSKFILYNFENKYNINIRRDGLWITN